jgi:hypothetical protein
MVQGSIAADLGRMAWRLEQHAGALQDASVPWFRGRTAGVGAAESILFHAQRDAHAAAGLLDAAGFPENATTVRDAATMLGATPSRTGALRAAGSGLARAVDAIPDRDALVAGYRLDPEYEAAAMLVKRPDELTGTEWRRLHQLVVDDLAGNTITLPRYRSHLKYMREITDYRARLAEGTATPPRHRYMAIDYNVQEHFDGWAAAQLPRADRDRIARAIAHTPAEELTRRDWATLSGLMTDDMPGLPRQLDGLRPFADIAWDRWQNTRTADGAERYLAKWRMRMDPAHASRLETALDAVVDGSASAEQRALAAEEWDLLAQQITTRPLVQRAAIASLMLQSAGGMTPSSVRDGLVHMRSALEQLPHSAEAAPIRADALELIDRNLSRIAGHTPDGAVRGYGTHPDYAELGRVRAHLSLLQAIAADEARKAARTGDAAATLTW